jgi:hypothetical protein
MGGRNRARSPISPAPRTIDAVTTVGPEVCLRPPLWARVWIVGFVPFWVWGWFTFQEGRHPGVLVWAVAVLVLALGARMLVVGAVGSSDGRLTVRNQFSTRTFRREELADAVVDRANGPRGFGWAVFVVLRDGSRHQVQVTQTPFRAFFHERLERDAERLRMWIRADGRPAIPA